jgi:hypothetical protein
LEGWAKCWRIYPSNLPKLSFCQDCALGSESHRTGKKRPNILREDFMILPTEGIKGNKETSSERGGARVVMVVEVPLESPGVYLGSIWVFGSVLSDLCNL